MSFTLLYGDKESVALDQIKGTRIAKFKIQTYTLESVDGSIISS